MGSEGSATMKLLPSPGRREMVCAGERWSPGSVLYTPRDIVVVYTGGG